MTNQENKERGNKSSLEKAFIEARNKAGFSEGEVIPEKGWEEILENLSDIYLGEPKIILPDETSNQDQE